jgi:hypothetical protein
MPSPRLFGRARSKKQGAEPVASEVEDNPRGRKRRATAEFATRVRITDDPRSPGEPMKPRPEA